MTPASETRRAFFVLAAVIELAVLVFCVLHFSLKRKMCSADQVRHFLRLRIAHSKAPIGVCGKQLVCSLAESFGLIRCFSNICRVMMMRRFF